MFFCFPILTVSIFSDLPFLFFFIQSCSDYMQQIKWHSPFTPSFNAPHEGVGDHGYLFYLYLEGEGLRNVQVSIVTMFQQLLWYFQLLIFTIDFILVLSQQCFLRTFRSYGPVGRSMSLEEGIGIKNKNKTKQPSPRPKVRACRSCFMAYTALHFPSMELYGTVSTPVQ